MEIKVIYGDARGRAQIRRGLIKWKNAARRRLCRNNGPAIPQALAPPQPRNPSARCLPGFITAPFITACLDNAVVVPIVRPMGMPSWPISPYRTLPRGESNTSVRLWTFPHARTGMVPWNVKRKEDSSRVPSQSGFARRELLSGTISLLSPRRIEVSLAADGNRESWDTGWERPVKWRKNGESARRQNYGRLIASSRN